MIICFILHRHMANFLLLALVAGSMAKASEVLPIPWLGEDIGAPVLAGTSNYSQSIFAISAAGKDIWGTSDQFHFVHQTLDGDGTIVARVDSEEYTNEWAKAGVMMRESLDPASPFVMSIMAPKWGSHLQWRSTAGSEAEYLSGTYWIYCPYWVKLVRQGGLVTAYSAPDNFQAPGAWKQIAEPKPLSTGTIHMGLVVTSHNESQLCTAAFSQIHITRSGGNADPSVATAAAAPLVIGSTATLSVLGADDGGEADLTYTWSTVWSSSGPTPAPVRFRNNGSHAARSTLASFTQAGAYLVRATITDAGGSSTYSDVAVTVLPSQSPVSPAFIEGIENPEPGAVGASAKAQGRALPVQVLNRTHFYLDVPLSASLPTLTSLSSTASTRIGAITWTPTPLTGSTSITIRAHDALLFKSAGAGSLRTDQACGAFAPETQVEAGSLTPQRFDLPGDYIVYGFDAQGNRVGSVAVTVVGVDFSGPVACEVGFTRGLDVLLGNGTHATFETTDPAAVQERVLSQDEKTARLSLACMKRGPCSLVARLDAPSRAIVATQALDLFAIEIRGRSGIVVNVSNHIGTDGLIMRPYVPGLDYHFRMFAHQATFTGGATDLSFRSNDMEVSQDLNTGEVIGVKAYDIELAPSENRFCYSVNITQAGRDIEEINYQTVNGTTCSLDVTRIYFAKGTPATKTLTISCAEKGVNHHGHPVAILGANAPTIDPVGYKAVCPDPVGVKNPPIDINPSPSAVTVAATPAGNYTVTIDGTPFADKVTVVGVTYNKAEVRPGVPNTHNASVTATVTPSDVTVTFAIDVTTRATVAPTSGAGSVPLVIDGLVLSGADKDTKLQALLPGVGEILPSLPVTVIEPKDYSETPAVTDNTPALKAGSATIIEWVNNVTVSIKDNFGIVLDDSWNGVTVEENVRGAGWSALGNLAGGTVTDPVRVERDYAAAPNPPGGAAYAASIVAGTRPAGARNAVSNDPQSIRIVDGGTATVLGPVNNRVNTFVGLTSTFTTTNSH